VDKVSDILQRLKNVKRVQGGWTAQCPGHDDQSNSLKISEGPDGKVLLHCFAGCTFERIIALVASPKPIESGAYQYRDESGEVLYEVVRKSPKGFAQRRKVGGGWQWNLKDTRRVLYRLPELIVADPNAVVYVCEGEKDADRLFDRGLVATTNSGGAGKWRPEYASFLKGRRVCIVPDNDEPGRAHAVQVARSLVRHAASVRILELPGLAEKGDVSDWLDAGGSGSDFVQLAREAPQFQETAEQPALQPQQAQAPQEPHNAEVERAVIEALMLDNSLVYEAKQLIPAVSMHVQHYRMVFSAMLSLHEEGMPLDTAILTEQLRRDGTLERVGGKAFLDSLVRDFHQVTTIRPYAEILRRHAKARWAIRWADKVKAAMSDDSSDPDEVLSAAMDTLGRAQYASRAIRRPRSIDEMYQDQALRYELFLKGVSNAIPTGFRSIDEKLLGGGLVPSLQYVLAARPSLGKTTLAIDIACNAAEAGYRVHVVTKEMPGPSILDRIVAAKANVERFRLTAGMTQRQYEAAMESLEVMRLVPIVLDDVSDTVGDVDGWLTEAEREGNRVDLLVVDYLQLMAGDGDGRVNEVSGLSRGFKGVAMKFEIPSLIVSQLRRPTQGHEDREPQLSDLRESGQIEQDADCALFLHGDSPEDGVDFFVRDLLCKKQRDGPTGWKRSLDMNGQLVTFRTAQQLGHPAVQQARPAVTPSTIAARRKGGAHAKGLAEAEARGQRKLASHDGPEENF